MLEARLYASASQGILSGGTPVPEGIRRCEELVERLGTDRRARAITLAGLAHLRAMNGDFEQARQDYKTGRAILEELGLRFDACTMSIDSGPVELMAGDPSAAEAELRRDHDGLDAMGERNYISSTAALLAEALWRLERFEEASSYAAFSREVAAPADVFSQHLWRGVQAKLLARQGAPDEAIALAESGVQATRTSDDIESQGNAVVFLAETLSIAGRLDDARSAADEARRLFLVKGNVVSAERARRLAPAVEPCETTVLAPPPTPGQA